MDFESFSVVTVGDGHNSRDLSGFLSRALAASDDMLIALSFVIVRRCGLAISINQGLVSYQTVFKPVCVGLRWSLLSGGCIGRGFAQASISVYIHNRHCYRVGNV